MRALRARGFTLVELLVVIVLMGVITAAIYQSIGSTQRITGTQVQRLHVQQSTRAAALYLTYALRELDASDGDIQSASATKLRIRGMRWMGVLCTAPVGIVGGVGFVLRDSLQFGVRAPSGTLDSILLFHDGDPANRSDDYWLVGGLLASGAGTCPDGTPGTVLNVTITAASGGVDSALAGVFAGAPIRGFQAEEIQLYQGAGGDYWLARRAADRGGGWSDMEELVGPLTANGLQFAYYDSTGAAATTVLDVASVGLVVRGRSPRTAHLPAGGIGYVRDSVITRVTLRNNQGF
ncbi:MAG: prepilin-type N-terminal cleavage/methylation domain-containing protein [Gemmatimonadota bacterium]|nr:MAG: prepilin-type N-terminal cleavage/methylation domain-containing protein [Gemmatimonadota bacterium]